MQQWAELQAFKGCKACASGQCIPKSCKGWLCTQLVAPNRAQTGCSHGSALKASNMQSTLAQVAGPYLERTLRLRAEAAGLVLAASAAVLSSAPMCPSVLAGPAAASSGSCNWMLRANSEASVNSRPCPAKPLPLYQMGECGSLLQNMLHA